MGERALKLVEREPDEAVPAGAVSPDAFLHAMRGVAASVVVVTTDGPAGRFGATVSSFTSVSVAPPTVLVCLDAASRIARAVRGNGRFAVNVLSVKQEDLAGRFAGRDDAVLADRFAGVKWSAEPCGAPALAGSGVLVCRLDAASRVATHDVCFGVVEHVRAGRDAPLAYLDRRFSRVAPL